MRPLIKVLNNGVELPTYATEGSAGFDIKVSEDIVVPAFSRILAPTGLFVEIQEGCEIQIRPRSGVALNHGVTVLNTPGTVDSDYRKEIGIVLINTTGVDVPFSKGTKIAQGVVTPTYKARFVYTDSLSQTERTGGFGSTGI